MTDSIVKSAGRAFGVLELFERERRELSLGDITSALNLPTSSGAALMKSLMLLGYLEYDRSRRTYLPTMRIAVLGGWIERALFGSGEILRRASELHAATGLMVILAVRSDLHAQYLHLIHPGEPLSLRVAPGELRPLARSAMGWLFLSALKNSEVRAVVRRIDYLATEERIDVAALLRDLQQVRASGYAFSKNLVTRGKGLIGTLVPRELSDRQLAIGVSGPTFELEKRQNIILRHIRDAVSID